MKDVRLNKMYSEQNKRNKFHELGFHLLEVAPCPEKPNFIKHVRTYKGVYHNSFIVECDFEAVDFLIDDYHKYRLNVFQELQKSVPKRQSEFVAGRFCAKTAAVFLLPEMADIFNLPIGKNREPVWPEPLSGSISHNDRTALSIVCLKQDNVTFGIDIEDLLTIETSKEIGNYVHSQTEHELLCLSGMSSNLATSIIYSAKESIFKCLYPSVEIFFGFEYANLTKVQGNRLIFAMNKENSLYSRFPNYIECQFVVNSETITTLCSISNDM